MHKILSALLIFSAVAFGIQPQRMVHCPTAGVANHGQIMFFASAFPGDGLRAGASLGLWDRVQVGVAYGAARIVGRGSVSVDPYPGLELKVRVRHEGIRYPAVVLGVETIGFGQYDSARKRYEHKSRGLYAVASKNWDFLWGNFGLHFGINYSFEENFNRGFSVFTGVDKDFKDAVGFKIEYDLAPGDWHSPRYNGYGYLSAALCVYFGSSSYATFNFFDILGNIAGKPAPAREFFVYFGRKLF